MAQSNVGKFDRMYQLLAEQNFEMNEKVLNKYRCKKCEKILINSHVGSCLCQFCRNCIDEMLASGLEKCPGNNDECKEEKLANFAGDHITNFKISKLILKCPEQMCLHECELVNMEDHLRVCSNRSITCPFFGMGCNEDKLIANGMEGHLQTESFNHNRILIEMIGTLRNELKKSDERNKAEIEALKENVRMKDKTIAEIQQQIQRNTTQIEQISTENVRMKDETIAEMQQQIKLIKMETLQMAGQINNLKVELDNKIGNSTQQMKQEWRDNLGREVRQINDGMEKWQLQLTSRIDGIEKWQDRQMETSFTCRINKLSDKLQNNTSIYSPIFYSQINSYKMQLGMENYAGSDVIYIWLYIHAGEMDAFITWPYKGNITINISNKAHPEASKSITQYCSILKPDNNSYKSSDPFKFSYKELSHAGLMNNYLVLQCSEE